MYGTHHYPRRPLHIGDALRWAPLGPGGDPQMSLQDVMRWAPLGPGGDPQMSLQDVMRWAPLGPGGDPQMSLQGLGQGAEASASYEVGGKVQVGPMGAAVAGVGGLAVGFLLGWMAKK